MKRSQFALVAMALIGAIGCNESTKGGPGVSQSPSTPQNQTVNKPVVNEKPVVNDSRETFKLRMPVGSTSEKQGESKFATIAISRGSDFDDDVQLTFTNVPTGVTLDPMNPTIARSDKEVKINITAADDAPIGDFTINVSAHPMKSGADAMGEFKVSISAK